MSTLNTRLQNLVSHDFVQAGLKQGVEIAQRLQVGSIAKAEAEYKRTPDEYEFYLIEVGQTLAHLLGLCEQLTHTNLFLTAFSPTNRMKEGGITRASHIQYNIENFLIRTQSLYDRVLKLVNAVFHLGLASRDCRHQTVLNNLHVKITDIPDELETLKKILDEYRADRNIVIHHTSYLADDLLKLEMLYLVQKFEDVEKEFYVRATQNLTRRIVTQRTGEFDQFTERVFNQLELLFNALKPIYDNVSDSLSVKCGYSSSEK